MNTNVRYPTIVIIAMLTGICFIPVFSALPFTYITSINIPDIILYYLLLLMFLEKIRWRDSYKRVKTPLDLPIIIFFLVAFVGLLAGRAVYSYDFFEAYLEFKVFIYYLIALVVPNIFRGEKEITNLIKSCFFLAIVVSLTLIVRSLASLEQITWTLNPADQISESIYYMFWAQGGMLVFWVFCCMLGLIIVQGITLLNLTGATLCSVFFVLSFSRHWWLSLFFSALLIFFIARRKYLNNVFKLIALLMIFAVVFASLALSGVQPFKRYKELISYRFHSLEWIDQTGSYTFRQIENEYAVKEIKKHFVFGIGFTKPYRPQVYYPEDNIRHFVHNGYLWILLKMGILGFIPFLWFSYLFVKRGLKNLHKINNTFYKGIVLGSVASYLGIAMGNLVAPHFTENWETAVLGLVFGVNEVIYRIELNRVNSLNLKERLI